MNIELVGVSVIYSQWGTSKTALNNISLQIASGSLVWITGPNGSGKTTLLGAIAGEIPLATGQIRIGETVVNTAAPPHDHVFLVPQNPMRGTVGTLSVFEHMLFAERRARIRRAAARESARSLLSTFGFDVELDQRVDSLSGGQRQLLSLVLALKRLPPIILLDEPTSALDAAHTLHARRIIREMVAQHSTVLVVSHNDCFDADTVPQSLFTEEGGVSWSPVHASAERTPANPA